jgi:hypothetical protein
MDKQQIITQDMLRGAAMVAWWIVGAEGLAAVIERHCPPGEPVSVGHVVDRWACYRALVEAVTAQGSTTASTQARSRSSVGPP